VPGSQEKVNVLDEKLSELSFRNPSSCCLGDDLDREREEEEMGEDSEEDESDDSDDSDEEEQLSFSSGDFNDPSKKLMSL
jgi:hypothetical protein